MKLTEKLLAALELPTDTAQRRYTDDEIAGLAVTVSKSGTRTFVYRGMVGDKRRLVTIGVWHAPHPKGGEWTLVRARQAAKELAGDFVRGVDPHVDAEPAATGPTLRDALTAHLAHMRAKRRAERSIDTMEHEVTKYAHAWLDRPIAELTGAAMVALHAAIKASAAIREGTNSANDKGAPLANRVVTEIGACWNSLNRQLEGKLGTWNPVKSVSKDVLVPKRERLDESAMPGWLARVAEVKNPIQRDGLMLALYTGLRSEDVRTIRHEHVAHDEDTDVSTLRLPDPKGGQAAAFTIPLSAHAREILECRARENADVLGRSDDGWAFPAVDTDGNVGPIGDLREKRRTHTDDGTEYDRWPSESPHVLRRTYESIAHEEGISELDVHVLTNHSFASHNVNATYISQHLAHLATCAERIDAGITRRLNPPSVPATKKTRARGKLTSVA